MEYIKRKYQDVKGTFDFALTYKRFFKTEELYGVNSLGIWIWPLNMNCDAHGFFEWKWIKEILVSEKNNAVYIVMPNMDEIIDNVALIGLKMFRKLFVDSKTNGEKALAYGLNSDWVTLLNQIIARDYDVRVISIE